MKRASALAICVVAALTLPMAIFAHGGRTDGKGGHYDINEGEYHYHHGYPAHDHYDMNGDGYIDCPYSIRKDEVTGDWQPQTEGPHTGRIEKPRETEKTEVTEEKTEKKKKSVLKEIGIWIIATAIVAGIPIALCYIGELVRFIASRLNKRR